MVSSPSRKTAMPLQNLYRIIIILIVHVISCKPSDKDRFIEFKDPMSEPISGREETTLPISEDCVTKLNFGCPETAKPTAQLICQKFKATDIALGQFDPLSFTHLDLSSKNISHLCPLAACKHLKSLDLSHNNIYDLDPLKALSHLEALNVHDNQIYDMEAIGSLRHLRSLDLSKNKFGRLSELDQLTMLRVLDFSLNRVRDLSQLKHLIYLEKLYASNNQITSLSPLSNLRKLRDLRLHNASDVKNHPYKNSFKILSIDLRSLTRLEILNLSGIGTQVNDVQFLAGFKQLKKLFFANNHLASADLSPLGKLYNIEEMDLHGNHIADNFSSISFNELSKLKILKLSHNKIVEADQIRFAKNIQKIELNYNYIDDTLCFQTIRSLIHLDVSNNCTTSFSNLYANEFLGKNILRTRYDAFYCPKRSYEQKQYNCSPKDPSLVYDGDGRKIK